jgi:hypothetical protein
MMPHPDAPGNVHIHIYVRLSRPLHRCGYEVFSRAHVRYTYTGSTRGYHDQSKTGALYTCTPPNAGSDRSTRRRRGAFRRAPRADDAIAYWDGTVRAQALPTEREVLLPAPVTLVERVL